MLKKALLMGMLALASSNASAYFLAGSDLIEPVREYRKAERGETGVDYSMAWYYRGYVLGVYDTNDVRYCTPQGFTIAQLMAVTAKYIEDNPKYWNEPADQLIASAIMANFPCKWKSSIQNTATMGGVFVSTTIDYSVQKIPFLGKEWLTIRMLSTTK